MRVQSLAFFILLIFSSTAYAIDVIPFVSPYNSYPAVYDFLTAAHNNVTIAVYTFTSYDIASMLVDLEKRRIDVRIMVEGGPVGGIEDLPLLCSLADADIDVRLYNGKLRFMHAKYAIADGILSLVSTENFGKSSFPPNKIGNKGYGIIIEDPELSRNLLEIFNDDMQTSKQPECEGVGKVILEKTPVPEYALKKIHAGSVEIVSSPLDNSEIDKISSLLASANNYLYIEQFYIDPWGAGKNPFLESAINAARNNAKVRILLDSTWYNVEDNDPKSNLVAADYANDIAKNESLDLEAKVYEGNLYEKIHSKVFFSDEISFISSINWNENSAKNNREIGLVVRGGDISNYYKPFFEADFEGRYPSRKPDEITGFISANSSIWIFVIVGVIALAVVILFLRNDKNGPRQS